MNFNFKILTIFIVILNVVNSRVPKTDNDDSDEKLKTGYFFMNQEIDHFNSSDLRTFKMKYAINSRLYKPAGPIIIYVGGETPISDDSEIFNYGELLLDIAAETHAVLYQTEHRYYGDSQPFDDLSTKNLKYLTIDQVTADIAHFIKTIKLTKPQLKDAKVILAGCSYPGTVVARFMQLYPELVNGGWASGALQLSKPDYEYVDLAGDTIKKINPNCYEKLRNAIHSIEEILFAKNNAKIQKMLGYCEDTDISTMELNYLDVVQTSIGSAVQTHSIDELKDFCNAVEEFKTAEEILESLYEGTSMSDYYKIRDETEKNEVYQNCGNYLHLLKSLNTKNTQRVYSYQGCIELGVVAPSKSFFNHRNFQKDIHLKACEDIFGISKAEVKKNIAEYNQRFGGLSPNITNIIWSSGDIDPWRGVQVQKNNDGSSAIIPNVNHCGEWGVISNWDDEPLKAMKTYIKKQIISWATADSKS